MKKLNRNLSLIAGLLLAIPAPQFARGGTATTDAQANKLIAVIQSNASQKEKADACRELARVGNRQAVAPLAALLPDEQLSHMARYALETIPDPSVDAAFRDALSKLHGKLLVGVIGSVGVRHDKQAVGQLARLLNDADADTAQAAARALGKIATPEAVGALQKAMPTVAAGNQVAFCEGLLRCAESMTAAGHRKEAMAIYDSLRSSSIAQVQVAALRGAILTRKSDGVALLVQTLQGPDLRLFDAALRTSLEMPGSSLTRTLAKELPGLAVERQVLLIRNLGQRGDAAAVPALTSTVSRGEKPVRLEALRAFGMIGSSDAVPTLVASLASDDSEIARTAKETLAALPGKAADKAVMAMIESAEPARSLAGMELASKRGMVAAIPSLVKLTKSQDAKLRCEAIKRYGELAGPKDMAVFADLLLSARDAQDREAAQQGLAAVGRKLNPDECAAKLQGLYASASPAGRCALLRVMGSIGGPAALKVVRAAVDDPDKEVHSAALRALNDWPSADAAPELLKLAKGGADSNEKALCLGGYLTFARDPDVPAKERLSMCREAATLVQKDDQKKLLLAALGLTGSLEAIVLINPYLEPQATREEACVAVLSIAEKILSAKRVNSAAAAKLAVSLDKAANLTAKPETAKRANALLGQAKAK